MSFSYQFGANPPIDYPRLLISDTVESTGSPAIRVYIFEDSEITAAAAINGLTWQSLQFFSPPFGRNLPAAPVNYLRTAALLLDSIASNKARISSITQLLDVKMDPSKASAALRAQAQEYRDVDDNSGAIMIIEQCSTTWSFIDRFWAQVQRQSGGGMS